MLTALYNAAVENKVAIGLGAAFTSTLYAVGAIYNDVVTIHENMGTASAATGALLANALDSGNSTLLELAVKAVIAETEKMVEHCDTQSGEYTNRMAAAYSLAATLTVAAVGYAGYRGFQEFQARRSAGTYAAVN